MSSTTERDGPTNQAGIYFQNCITVLRLVDTLTTKYVPLPDAGEILSVRAEASQEVDDTVVEWSSGRQTITGHRSQLNCRPARHR